MVKILRVTVISIALMIFFLPTSVFAQDIVAVRDISPALADNGGIINVTISFTVPQGLTGGIGISETNPGGWNATNVTAIPSATIKNESKLELVWTTTPSGNVVVTYKLRVPGDAQYADDYLISGDLTIGNKSIPIEGDNLVIVSSIHDTQRPVINYVMLNKARINDVLVTANVTDDYGVYSVKANNVILSKQGDFNWTGAILGVWGTNVPIVVVAKDAGGNIATQQFSSTQTGATQTPQPSGYQAPATGTPTSRTTTVPAGVTPGVTAPEATATSGPTSAVTVSPTPARASPGFGLAFAIVGLVAIAYRIKRGS